MSEDRKFKIGDVVKLAGGSPLLTVIAVHPLHRDQPALVECAWMTPGAIWQRQNVPEVALVLAPPETAPPASLPAEAPRAKGRPPATVYPTAAPPAGDK